MDIAMENTDPKYRSEFMKRRSNWHSQLKIVDTELAGMAMDGRGKATVQIDVSWIAVDDTTLQVTRLEQKWHNNAGKWMVDAEEKIGGADGLFGEEVEEAKHRRARQFQTTVIR